MTSVKNIINDGKTYYYGPQASEVQAETVAWIKSGFVPGEALAVSLQIVQSSNGVPMPRITGDNTIYQYARHLNRAAYGQRSRKENGGERVGFVAVAEGGVWGGPELHYHGIIEVPMNINIEEWAVKCSTMWKAMRLGGKHSHFALYESEEWVDYIMKRRTKVDLKDALVSDALHIPAREKILH